ncbi:hypothetical protein F3Y22_tig00113725pilonHSYRG01679 [Hibiscus syriacus]|uniref:Uncharacterized protein n=1 Tax=Hibiscus syriacus TaxID=106335 RepID=A0A6A2XHT5_HIBSY|nr:hypothetical protein F3Y22_tig00113725pilonHSYRG01679 [Hibiscus syriacus]
MERCGPDSSIAELTDFICAAQMDEAADALFPVEDRKPLCNDLITRKDQITQRTLPEDAIGHPYFYYENVALAPVGAWTEMSRNKVVPLEPDDVEMLIGFPKNHTQGRGSARDIFPGGINVLSLFSGISDAEVAFYYLGIPLKTDSQELNGDRLEQLMSRFGEFDLVVSGIQFQQSSEGHNGYNPDKENDQHGRSSNDVPRLEPVSQYNQSASRGLVHSHNTP